jgi:hypothetical protein
MTSERLTTRALAASVGIGAGKTAGVEARLGKRALAFGEALLGLREAEDEAILGRDRLLALARLLLSRPAQIDDLAQNWPRLLLPEGVDRHDFGLGGGFGGFLRALA